PTVTMRASTVCLASLVLAAACGDDPVSFSEPVAINVHAKSADVANAVVSDDKNINTESGNPYGAFVTDARAKLGGEDPGRIDVAQVTLLLGAGSTGVTTLDEIFAGQVDMLFVMNDSNTSAPVASRAIAAGAGAGPLTFDVTFDDHALASADYARLLGG